MNKVNILGTKYTILCWSGGKDSTATVILAHENHIKIDNIIMSEVMFDKSKGISNEDEEHMEFVLMC